MSLQLQDCKEEWHCHSVPCHSRAPLTRNCTELAALDAICRWLTNWNYIGTRIRVPPEGAIATGMTPARSPELASLDLAESAFSKSRVRNVRYCQVQNPVHRFAYESCECITGCFMRHLESNALQTSCHFWSYF
jgi:hypothetical protein